MSCELNDVSTGARKKSQTTITYCAPEHVNAPHLHWLKGHTTHQRHLGIKLMKLPPPYLHKLPTTSTANDITNLLIQIPQTHIQNRIPHTHPNRPTFDRKEEPPKREGNTTKNSDTEGQLHTHNLQKQLLSPTSLTHQKYPTKSYSSQRASKHHHHAPHSNILKDITRQHHT